MAEGTGVVVRQRAEEKNKPRKASLDQSGEG